MKPKKTSSNLRLETRRGYGGATAIQRQKKMVRKNIDAMRHGSLGVKNGRTGAKKDKKRLID